MRAFPIALLIAALGHAGLIAAPRHTTLLLEATAAARSGDQTAALRKLEEAAHLRPDYPRIQLTLARLAASLNQPETAFGALQRLTDMGVQSSIAADPVFASLHHLPRFQALAEELASGPPAVVPVDTTAVSFPGVTGIIESCLIDPVTRDWYLADVHNRCIWRREAESGELVKFTHNLDGVFKITLAPDRKTLWAAIATVAVMTGTEAEDGKRSSLIAIDFATGRVNSRHDVPDDGRKHLLGDFILTTDGTIYATDSFSPIIWRLPDGANQLEPWLESDEFLNLQGLAFSADGQSLFVADYANGLWQIDVATKTIDLLQAPANASFFGIDGLYSVPGGLIAVQNGLNPQRVLHVIPAGTDKPSTTRILTVGHPAMTDLSLGTVFNGRFYFIADSGWALFDPPPPVPPPARSVTVLSVGWE